MGAGDSLLPEMVDSLEAYESIAAELSALGEDELAQVNVDIMVAVTTALGCIPALRRFRAELVRLPGFDVERFDKLETYARAAGHAHARHLRVTSGPDVSSLVEAATRLREILLADASALGRRGLIDAAQLGGLKGPVGYRNLAFDLSALSSVLREAWPRLEGKTATTRSELDEARALADRLLTAVGVREQSASATSPSALARQRAFTLFIRTYDQTRRAFTYLRWDEDDLDELVPSVYERRASRKAAASEAAPRGSAPVEAASAAGAARAPTQAAGVRLGPSPVGVGLPGAEPFDES